MCKMNSLCPKMTQYVSKSLNNKYPKTYEMGALHSQDKLNNKFQEITWACKTRIHNKLAETIYIWNHKGPKILDYWDIMIHWQFTKIGIEYWLQ